MHIMHMHIKPDVSPQVALEGEEDARHAGWVTSQHDGGTEGGVASVHERGRVLRRAWLGLGLGFGLGLGLGPG